MYIATSKVTGVGDFLLASLAVVGWLAHSSYADGDCGRQSIASLYWRPCSEFSFSSGLFWWLDKIYLSIFLGGATPVSWLSWPDVRLFGWLGGFRSSGPLLLAFLMLWRLILGLFGRLDGVFACNIDRLLGGVFDGAKGNAALLRHPAQYVYLLDYLTVTWRL